MKKSAIICIAIFMALATIVFAASSGDRLYQSVGDFTVQGLTNIQIQNNLLVDKVVAADGVSPVPGWVPIGGMIAVMPSTNANAWQPDSGCAIKDGFVRAGDSTGATCVVPTCSDCGIPAGTALPNMAGRFLRGPATAAGTSNLVSSGGTVRLVAANIPTLASSAVSGSESASHTHGMSHNHSTSITDVNSASHAHTGATHGHTGSVSDDINVGSDAQSYHYHGTSSSGLSWSHTHGVSNGGGEPQGTSYGANGGDVCTFRFAPSKPATYPPGTHVSNIMYAYSGAGGSSHTHPAGNICAGATHSHTGTTATGSASTGNNDASHNHTLSGTSGLTFSDTTGHTQTVSWSFGNATPAILPDPTNITVIWVIRVR